MRRLGLALLVAAMLMPVGAAAQRNFPQSAKRGELSAHQYPYYTIDKKILRLAVGGKIYDQHNMIVMPVRLQAQKAEVMYRLDMNGEVAAIWLLTAAEAAARPRPKRPESRN